MVGLIILLVMTSSFSKIDEKASMTHAKFDVLLKKHVSAAGNVNYEGFKKDVAALDSYLKELSASVPGASASRNERLAYYMNAYNAFTVKLILNNYPVTSIKNISAKPWDIKFIKLGDETHSLNTIEHNILRKMGDPRIHVGINCASVSCPKLLNKAFTAANVTAELTKLTKLFLKDTTKNKITTTSASISEIFSWFKTDFTKKGTMIDWINKYSEVKIKAGTKITYMKYNWNLNK
jgi:hypothetical protein